jgi:Flp pilus assembly protein TadG
MMAFKSFLRDESGASVVEFGFIAPVIVAFFIAVLTGATLVSRYNAMHTGIAGGAQYIMAGGADLDTVKAITKAAWPAKTGAASVNTSKVCRCGTTTSACSTSCTGGSAPEAYISIIASDTVSEYGVSKAISATREVRIR